MSKPKQQKGGAQVPPQGAHQDAAATNMSPARQARTDMATEVGEAAETVRLPAETLAQLVIAQQKTIDGLQKEGGKDAWDKFAALSTFLSSVVLGLIGLYFTHSYQAAESERLDAQQREQQKLEEIKVIGEFMPHLTSEDERVKSLAIAQISRLTNVGAAIGAAEAAPSVGTLAGLQHVAGSPTLSPEDQQRVAAAMARISERLPRVPILFVTDRVPDQSGDVGYGTTAGSLRFGALDVNVPETHRVGQIEQPRFWERQNEQRHFSILKLTELPEASFTTRFGERLAGVQSSEAVIFVPDFKESFESSALKFAQLLSDIQYTGVGILYSWPSSGTLTQYVADEAAVERSVPSFRGVLDAMQRVSPRPKLSIVGQGLGCRLVLEALVHLTAGQANFDEVVFLVPDLDRTDFGVSGAPELPTLVRRITIYASSDPSVLGASRLVHQSARLGDASAEVPVFEKIDTILVTPDAMVEHAYVSGAPAFYRDLMLLLSIHTPADQRRTLRASGTANMRYWELVAQ